MFELLLFVLFVVVPIVNRLRRGSQNQNQRPGQGQTGQSRQGQAGQGQTGQGQAGQGQTGQGQPNQGQPRQTGNPNDAFRKRLEEARQRVLEAERANQQGQSNQQSSQQGQPRQSARANTPSRPPLVPVEQAKSDRKPIDRPVLAQQDDRRIEGYGTSLEGKSLAGTSLETTTRLSKSGSSKSSQSRPSKTSTRTARKDPNRVRIARKRPKKIALEVNRNALMRGIIWREIFNDPVSKRKNHTSGRQSSAQRPRP